MMVNILVGIVVVATVALFLIAMVCAAIGLIKITKDLLEG